MLGEDQRDPVELERRADLPDEEPERLLHVERRRERPGAAVRELEAIRVAADLVAELLGLGGAGLRARRLPVELARQPAHDEPDDELDAER